MDAICKNNAEAVKTRVTFPYVTLITENRTLWLLCRERKRAHKLQWSITMFHERRRHGELGLYTYCMYTACMWTISYNLQVINIKKCHGKQGQTLQSFYYGSIKWLRLSELSLKAKNSKTCTHIRFFCPAVFIHLCLTATDGWMSSWRIYKGTSFKCLLKKETLKYSKACKNL